MVLLFGWNLFDTQEERYMKAEIIQAHGKAVRGDFRNPEVTLYPGSRNV